VGRLVGNLVVGILVTGAVVVLLGAVVVLVGAVLEVTSVVSVVVDPDSETVTVVLREPLSRLGTTTVFVVVVFLVVVVELEVLLLLVIVTATVSPLVTVTVFGSAAFVVVAMPRGPTECYRRRHGIVTVIKKRAYCQTKACAETACVYISLHRGLVSTRNNFASEKARFFGNFQHFASTCTFLLASIASENCNKTLSRGAGDAYTPFMALILSFYC
jgi:hypothetical protein